ncbi:hypothetical protein DV532_19885 [Pseudomonas sp. Leaf58]|nr:hypothetical protein DV532_19885 [Pseudomonas sp. Leaf58]KQN60139.1 hypothetical protein ASF02_16780 [Pseudomonas sp. Leaf58]
MLVTSVEMFARMGDSLGGEYWQKYQVALMSDSRAHPWLDGVAASSGLRYNSRLFFGGRPARSLFRVLTRE